MKPPVRLVVLVSGGGTTLQNLIDRTTEGRLMAQIVGVIASRTDSGGIRRAEAAGIPVKVVERSSSHSPSSSRQTETAESAARSAPPFADRVWKAVREFEPELVVLAGWLHLLPVPGEFKHRVLNIHPSLLPAFGGKGMYGHHVHEAVLEHGAKVTGCTVHFADDTYDTGPILVQRCVLVQDQDTPDTLAARVFQVECEAYPEAITLLAEGRVTVQGRRVVITD